MDYTHLTTVQRRSQLEDELRNIEQQHFALSTARARARAAGHHVPDQDTDLAKLDAEYAAVRDLRDALPPEEPAPEA